MGRLPRVRLNGAEAPVMNTLVCFGDSNTHGTVPMKDVDDIRRFGPDERWTGSLSLELGPGWRVHEEGLPGRTTVHPDPIEGEHLSGLAVIPIVLGTHMPIDAMTIMLGTNDLKARFGLRPSDIAAGVERLILATEMYCRTFRRPLPRILIVAPPPILEVGPLREMFAGGQEKSHQLAPALAGVAQRHQLAFLNAGEHIGSSEVDGVHFDLEQHARLAQVVKTCLTASTPN